MDSNQLLNTILKLDKLALQFYGEFCPLYQSLLCSQYLQQCKRFCVLDSVMQDCGCFHPLYLDIDDTREEKPPCNLGNSTVDLCIKRVMAQFSGALRACPCNQVSKDNFSLNFDFAFSF